MPRWAGGCCVTSLPSTKTWPLLADSRPAMMRSVVDLPQPDGPSRTQNVPGSMARSMPSSALVSPHCLETFTNWIDDMAADGSGWVTG